MKLQSLVCDDQVIGEEVFGRRTKRQVELFCKVGGMALCLFTVALALHTDYRGTVVHRDQILLKQSEQGLIGTKITVTAWNYSFGRASV